MYMNETFAASCFVYKHTTFERQISVTNATSQPPATVNSPLSWAQCFQECHFLPHCQSLSLEGNVCSLYTSGGHPGSNVFSVVSSTIYSNRQELTESKCTMNGYVYDSQFSVCYKADTRLANNSYAHQLCSQTGGRLMVIDSQRKQEFIGNITFPTGPGVSNFRIDAFQSQGIWRFADGREITSFYWGVGEPSNGYPTICISIATNKWNDVHVNYNHAVLCEKVL
ncbi:C-type lectin domain family 4 member E-like [Crassostrea virginica]